MTAPVRARLRRPDHRIGSGRRHHGGDPRRGRPRRDRGRGRTVGRAGVGRAVLAGADGPPVPLRRRHGRPRTPVDRVHRGSLCGRRHRGEQRSLPAPPGRDARAVAHRIRHRRLRLRRHRGDLRRGGAGTQRASRAGRAHRPEREAPPRRRAARLEARRDPALDGVSRAGQRRRRAAAEHDASRTSPAPNGPGPGCSSSTASIVS